MKQGNPAVKGSIVNRLNAVGNVVVNGTWEQLFINSSRAAAYDVTIVGTMTVGTSGKYIGHGSTHVAGDVSSCGMMALMKPAEFAGTMQAQTQSCAYRQS